MNKVSLIGNLVRDAEFFQMKDSSRGVIKFTLGVNSGFVKKNGERDVDFIPIAYWSNHAEKLLPYLLKGKQVAVIGEIKTRTYQTEDGTKKYITEVNASNVQFLSKSKEAVI